jgi:hypothetical protein
MDVKIISALNDLTLALDAVAESLKDKSAKSEAGKILQSINNIDKKMESISNGLKSIKKDTTQILKNQETLLKISKDKKETKLFEISGENKAKIKDGVNTVISIAAGVLAIGVAFKLIGSVDFLSVIALSIALPLIAMSFEKISEMKGLKKEDMKNLFFVTVTMAASITAASWIMTLIAPISISQGLTAILIAGTFALIGMSIEKLTKSVEKIKPKDIENLPKILIKTALAITGASWIMKLIMPISFAQGLTAILIAGTFAVISYGIEKIVSGIKKIEPGDIANLPEVLITFALAITGASWIMKLIMPISFNQGLTAILIAGTFAVISYGIEKIVKATKDIKAEDVVDLPFVLIAFSVAITASSVIMQLVQPIKYEQFLTAIGIAATFAVMSLSLPLLAMAVKMTSLKDAFLMVGILPLLALAVVGVSYVLQKLQIVDSNVLLNMVEQSLAIAISAAAIGGTAFLLSKIGVTALIQGGIAVVGLAAVIAASSWVLSMGNYDGKYPTLEWAEGVGLSLVAFGVAVAGLGLIAITGIGTAALLAGAAAVLGLAGVIVATSYILKTGVYDDNYPKVDWAKGVGESLAAFGSVLANMGLGGLALNLIGNFLGNGPVAIAQQIVDVNSKFSGVKFEDYPDTNWAEGVAKSLVYFGSITSSIGLGGMAMNKIGEWLGNGPVDIAEQIVNVSKKLSEGVYGIYPNTDWVTGVTTLIAQFAAITSSQDLGDILSNKLLGSVPESIAEQIKSVSLILSGGTYTTGLPDGYMKSLSDNVRMYVDLVEYLESKDLDSLSFLSVLGVTSGLSKLAEGYEKLSKGVKSLGSALASIDMEKIEALNRISGNVILMSLMDSDQFESMMDALEEKAGIFVKVVEELQGEAEKTGKSSSYPVGNMGGKGSSATSALEQKMDQLVANTTNLAANIGAAVANSIKSPFETLIAELKNQMGKKERKSGTK